MNITHLLLYLTATTSLVLIVGVYLVRICGRQWFASALSLFFLMQLPFVLGTLLSIDWNDPLDFRWMWSMVGGMAMVVAGAALVNHHYRFRPRQEIVTFCRRPIEFDVHGAFQSVFVVGLALSCVVVGIGFSQAVGYNVLAEALSRFARDSVIDQAGYSTRRVSISTEKYVAAGYAVQFTAILLPLALYLLYSRYRSLRRATDVVLLLVLVVLDLYFLTIAGGRLWLIHLLLAFMVLFWTRTGPLPRVLSISGRAALACLIGIVVFYGLATTLMGRAGTTSEGAGKLAQNLVKDAYDRTAGYQAETQRQIMHILADRGTAWGSEWASGVAFVLPRSGKDPGLSAELHELLFRGAPGQVGLTLWNTLLYNWGYAGLLVFCFVIGAALQAFTVMYVRGGRSLLRVVILFIAGYRLSLVRDPYSLLLEGFVTTVIFYGLVRALVTSHWIRVRSARGSTRSSTTTSVPGLAPDRRPSPAPT